MAKAKTDPAYFYNSQWKASEYEIEQIINKLNALYNANPEAIKAIFSVSSQLDGFKLTNNCLTMKAILNLVLGYDDDDMPRIAFEINSESGEILGFCRFDNNPEPEEN